jgi:hypothetical protein
MSGSRAYWALLLLALLASSAAAQPFRTTGEDEGGDDSEPGTDTSPSPAYNETYTSPNPAYNGTGNGTNCTTDCPEDCTAGYGPVEVLPPCPPARPDEGAVSCPGLYAGLLQIATSSLLVAFSI